MEADGLRGKVFDTELYSQLADRLGKCLCRIGLERVAKPIDGVEVKNVLTDYFSKPLADREDAVDAAE
jgi:hypothetical protein